MSRSSFRSLPVFWASLLALALAGCATPSQTSAEDPGATPEGGATKTGEGEMKADNANEAKPEGAATATAASEGAATPTPASTDAPAPAPAERAAPEASSALSVSAEPAANPETAKLIAQLNDASRELAILRVEFGLGYEDIAAETALPAAMARAETVNALAALIDALGTGTQRAA